MSKNDFLELSLISEAIGAGDKSLKEAMRIFDRVMSNNNGAVNKNDFEAALEKHIEEKVSLEDVVMSDDTKADIVDRIDKFLQSDDVSTLTKGMILTGPPGTGKTFIVKALANEKNCSFMSPSLADLKGEYIGQTSGKVKRVFQQARANAPTILFIDEADTVFPLRDIGSGDSDSFTKDIPSVNNKRYNDFMNIMKILEQYYVIYRFLLGSIFRLQYHKMFPKNILTIGEHYGIIVLMNVPKRRNCSGSTI